MVDSYVNAIILAAGKGTRINSKVPKQFIKVKNKNIVAYTIDAFEKHSLIDEIVLVTSKEYVSYTQNMVIANRFNKIIHVIEGGETRQESVRNGLNSTSFDRNDNILIHDGDRPLVSEEIIGRSIKELYSHQAVVAAIRSDEALEGVHNLGRKCAIKGVSYDIQTPQSFKYKLIKDAHNKYKDESVSDDASLIEKEGLEITYISGSPLNFKITTDQDLKYFKEFLEKN